MMFFIHRTTAPGDIYLSDVRQGANDALQRVQGEREREVVVSRTQSPAKVVVVVNVVVAVVGKMDNGRLSQTEQNGSYGNF